MDVLLYFFFFFILALKKSKEKKRDAGKKCGLFYLFITLLISLAAQVRQSMGDANAACAMMRMAAFEMSRLPARGDVTGPSAAGASSTTAALRASTTTQKKPPIYGRKGNELREQQGRREDCEYW
jgi:hypothetical protein